MRLGARCDVLTELPGPHLSPGSDAITLNPLMTEYFLQQARAGRPASNARPARGRFLTIPQSKGLLLEVPRHDSSMGRRCAESANAAETSRISRSRPRSTHRCAGW